MRKRNYLKLLLGMFVMVVSTTFMGCVDDNDDTSAPYLKVTPTSLAFNEDGTPKEGDGQLCCRGQPSLARHHGRRSRQMGDCRARERRRQCDR